MDYPLVWAGLLAFAIIAYVVLDGFDLGVGMLTAFARAKAERDIMIDTIAPVWDGNETWLVLGGGALFAAFPLAYAILLPAFYVPLTAMLVGLVFRGVAFEFRARTHNAGFWDAAFVVGSVTAGLAQGIVLGAFVQGVTVADRGYGGGWFDWLTPFSVFTGVSLVAGYALLGATWLLIKTSGSLQARCRSGAQILGAVVIAAIIVISIWTPLLDPIIADRWFNWPQIAYLSPIPLLIAVLAMALFRALRAGHETSPFFLVLGLFLVAFAGLCVSIYPFVVPRRVTIWQAAAPPESLSFMFTGAAILLPVILGYTAYAYWVFRGKVTGKEGYH